MPTEVAAGIETVLKDIKKTIAELVSHRGIMLNDLGAVGIGVAGSVDMEAGLVRLAPNLSWRNIPLGAKMETLLGLPVVVDNDAHAAALAEKWQGAGRQFDSLLMVTLGTGIGSALIIDGKIHRGFWGYGAELGHAKVAFEGPLCSCGSRGCLETFASAAAVVRTFRDCLAAGRRSVLQNSSFIDARLIVKAAAQGDELACQVLDQASRYLGLALANAVILTGPEAVIVGGGLAGAGEIILDPLEKYMDACLGPWQIKPLPVLTAQLGNDAGFIGAAYLASRIQVLAGEK